jgi:hypothetical protein
MPARRQVDVALHGSYLCEDYELRVTNRCLSEDLHRPVADPFREIANHEIITAFINRRRSSPENTRQVSPLSTGRTVYRLAYGERHRGATWHDEVNGVVWLLAYAQHEFEGAGDAFPYFKQLDAEDRLLPTAEDYEALFGARAARFAEVVAHDCAALLEAARASPGVEVVGHVADLEISVAIDIAESLEEINVAFKLHQLTPENLAVLLAALFPQNSFDDLQTATHIAGRSIARDEIVYRGLVER